MEMKTRTRIDFLQLLDVDVALRILTCLNDSADLVRASAVSQFWKDFVISHEFCKQLCVRTFPQLVSITRVTEPHHASEPAIDDSLGHITFKREHNAYGALFHALTSFPIKSCISHPISASSTDRYPEESIINTLDPSNGTLHGSFYWSSIGQGDPEVPENLIYALNAKFCLITEIHITPFQAMTRVPTMVYSAKFVRFRMGHPKSLSDIDRDFVDSQRCADDKFVWTYTSQTFPMVQESWLQKFKLPEPVLCIGGYLQIEFLGRVRKEESDEKYYICMDHVKAIGRQLSPGFCAEFLEQSGTNTNTSVSLKYDIEEFEETLMDNSLSPSQDRKTCYGFTEITEYAYDSDDDDLDEEDELDHTLYFS